MITMSIAILAALAGACALYARGSWLLGWDATWSKILVSGCAGAALGYLAGSWWGIAVGAGTALGHAGWTGKVFGRLGDHDGVLPLLDDRPDDWRAWLSGAISGHQITLPMAVLLAANYRTFPGSSIAITVLLAGAAKPIAYWVGGRVGSAPAAEAIHAVMAWGAMLAAAMVVLIGTL